jgi:glycosyltransferase involved in cell wall biosynthesis
VLLNIEGENSCKKNNACNNHSEFPPNALRMAIITEDLRLPLDEGAKKTSFSLIRSFINRGVKVSVFTCFENPLLNNTFLLPRNKFLIGYQFGRDLHGENPNVILYVPVSSGTVGAFIRAAVIKSQSYGKPVALLNLQYRKLPAFVRYFDLQRFVDIVYTQSQASSDAFRSLGCPSFLLPGGVDHTIFHPVSSQEKGQLRLKHCYQDTDKIVLHVGHGNRGRNVTTLSWLVKLGYKVVLITSTTTAVDRPLIAELRQSGVTVITDFIENIQHFYQMADCYLFPVFLSTSAIDTPLSVLEAMACNIPIVTTRFGALPGLFQSGNGFNFIDTETELVQLVNQAVQEHDCRTVEMVSQYSWDNVASTILDTLQETHNL